MQWGVRALCVRLVDSNPSDRCPSCCTQSPVACKQAEAMTRDVSRGEKRRESTTVIAEPNLKDKPIDINSKEKGKDYTKMNDDGNEKQKKTKLQP